MWNGPATRMQTAQTLTILLQKKSPMHTYWIYPYWVTDVVSNFHTRLKLLKIPISSKSPRKAKNSKKRCQQKRKRNGKVRG